MENIVTPKKKALAILCICSSAARLSVGGASHPRMIVRRVACVFMSPAPCRIVPRRRACSHAPVRSFDSAAMKRRKEFYGLCQAEVSRALSSSHSRSRRPRLAASPTVSVANSSTCRHRDQRRRRTAPRQRRRSGGCGIDGNERTQTD